jgi:hypothetical protein
MTEMTVRAACIIRGSVMMPVAHDTGGEDQQRDERQRYAKISNCLPSDHSNIATQFPSE